MLPSARVDLGELGKGGWSGFLAVTVVCSRSGRVVAGGRGGGAAEWRCVVVWRTKQQRSWPNEDCVVGKDEDMAQAEMMLVVVVTFCWCVQRSGVR